ncbi:hypothetical protein L226DRAFT_49048 [Lentinus tigrinus ALCF2SS1-7]|uniref:uncharacterized protein n=1 Tax=Lentinus tigrinus ALCF2SS1-7 TaxID=1328758 RepID=UPI001165E121|nr:hypothetical protein L226DRAFT_49048 [Lentinus tigrinus ALCF2SS1-7]
MHGLATGVVRAVFPPVTYVLDSVPELRAWAWCSVPSLPWKRRSVGGVHRADCVRGAGCVYALRRLPGNVVREPAAPPPTSAYKPRRGSISLLTAWIGAVRWTVNRDIDSMIARRSAQWPDAHSPCRTHATCTKLTCVQIPDRFDGCVSGGERPEGCEAITYKYCKCAPGAAPCTSCITPTGPYRGDTDIDCVF